MNQNHFEVLAEVVQHLRAASDSHGMVNVNFVAGELAKFCAAQNDRFDALRFLEACGVPGIPEVEPMRACCGCGSQVRAVDSNHRCGYCAANGDPK